MGHLMDLASWAPSPPGEITFGTADVNVLPGAGKRKTRYPLVRVPVQPTRVSRADAARGVAEGGPRLRGAGRRQQRCEEGRETSAVGSLTRVDKPGGRTWVLIEIHRALATLCTLRRPPPFVAEAAASGAPSFVSTPAIRWASGLRPDLRRSTGDFASAQSELLA